MKLNKVALLPAELRGGHDCSIMHRDVQHPNSLAKRQPLVVVLSYFGAPREILPLGLEQVPEQPLTPGLVTLWYRAPEFLFGRTYALPSDVWSTGVTLVEIEQGCPPFQQSSEMAMIADICHAVGGGHSKEASVEVRKQLRRQVACQWAKYMEPSSRNLSEQCSSLTQSVERQRVQHHNMLSLVGLSRWRAL